MLRGICLVHTSGISNDDQVFVSFASMSYNPDTSIKDPQFSLKL